VVSGDAAGRFALDLGEQIASVSGWYAWDETQVFLPQNGGEFDVTLGAVAEDVTRLTALPDRAELVSVTGDGRELQAVIDGGGIASLNLGPDWGRDGVIIRGVDGASNWTGDGLDLILENGMNTVVVDYVDKGTGGTTDSEIIIGGNENDEIVGRGGADWLLGEAGADDFIFRPTSAGSVVQDFEPNEDDLIFEWNFSSGGYPWFREKDVLAAFVDYDGGTRLMDGEDVFLDLVGVSGSQLDRYDIAFDYEFFLS
jgi:serralysin